MTASGTISRARGFLRSNLRKNGTLHAARNTSPIIMSEFITIVSQRLNSPYGLIVALVA